MNEKNAKLPLWITTVYILQNSANVLAIEIVITN